ncbi:MAG: hypothetical protein ACTSWG_08090 [Candidatus Helarchaeota archaeon]
MGEFFVIKGSEVSPNFIDADFKAIELDLDEKVSGAMFKGYRADNFIIFRE